MVEPLLGLTGEEAARRLSEDGPNELPSAGPRNLVQQAWDVVRQPMLLLLIAAGTVNFLLAEPLDGIVLMSFVLVVIAISIYQEHKTESALVALRDLSSPRGLVVRDGTRVWVAGREVVRGDAVVLAEGDRVPADAVLVEAVNMGVDESALTGESVPVRKAARSGGVLDETVGARPGGDGTPWVFSGTLVVRGHGVAIVSATGARTELGRIGTALRSIQTERTPLQREIDRLVAIVAAVGVAAAVGVVVIYGLTRGNWLEGLLAGIATAMAMLPEEFPVVLTVFMALGAWRLSRRRVLTRRSAVIETLGSATVLCVDKTGTLTMNEMAVRSLVAADGAIDDRLIEAAVLASPPDPFDPMDRAIVRLGEHRPEWHLVREYPLSESMLAMSHAWRRPDGCIVVASKGAPEAIARLCRLNAEDAEAMIADVERLTAGGQRVLGVGYAELGFDVPAPEAQSDIGFAFVGLVGLQDPVRPGVADAVAECTRAGVRTVMITGDYPGTARAIATEIGLDLAAGVITGSQLDAMDDDELALRVRDARVFARMVPEQKLRLIRAFRANGDVVGMTGDGVNDAPALRAADIGIAMGARGTDVARESAALVITDDDFSSIVGGVRQGRVIFDNLRKAMAYIIAVHVPIFGMSLIPVLVADWPLALLPLQIAFLELIIDPACSVVFEAEGADPRIMEASPRGLHEPIFGRRVLLIAVLQGVSVLIAVLAVYLWAVQSGRSDEVVRSMTFIALVAGNLALILVNRSWRLTVLRTFRERRNPTVRWMLLAAGGLLIVLLTVPWLREAFRLGAIGPGDWVVAVGAGLLGVAWFEVFKAVRARRPSQD